MSEPRYIPTPAEIAAATAAIDREHQAAPPDERSRPRLSRRDAVQPGILQPTRDFVHQPPGPDSWL